MPLCKKRVMRINYYLGLHEVERPIEAEVVKN